MATCERKNAPVQPPPTQYVLTLDETEASLLKHLLAGATCSCGDGLWDALDRAGARVTLVGHGGYSVRSSAGKSDA